MFATDKGDDGIYLGALGANDKRPILPFLTPVRLTRDGHMLFSRGGALTVRRA